MPKKGKNNRGTYSSASVNKARIALAEMRTAPYSQNPAKRSTIPDANGLALADLEDVILANRVTAGHLYLAHDEDKINEAKGLIKSALEYSKGKEIFIRYQFHIDYGGEVHMDALYRDNMPVMKEPDSTYYRAYFGEIKVKTENPDISFAKLKEISKDIEKKLNKEYNLKTEKLIRERDQMCIPERVEKKIRDFDPFDERPRRFNLP